MKYSFAAATAACVVLAFTGCATPTRVKSGPIQASTFDFMQAAASRSANFSDNRQEAHAFIQQAVTDQLAAKGVRRDENGPDIKVAYLIIVGDNVSSVALNEYFGYGRDASALADVAHEAYAIDNKNPDQFEAGTLLIDILDAKTHKLLLRNYAVRPILRETSASVREENIRDAVNEVLKSLRIAH